MKVNFNIQNINPSFKSYIKLNQETNLSVATSFYHDLETLKKAVEIIENNFPDGADVLVYAGSNGEEAISILSMFKNPEKYGIYSIDICSEAIEYANRGIYSVHSAAKDGFLVDNNENFSADEQMAKNNFSKVVTKIEEPPFKLNNITDPIYYLRYGEEKCYTEKFYELNPSVRKKIKFVEGDIRDIKTFKTEKPVGGIFFRNALYHLTNNDLSGVFTYGDEPDKETNKLEVLQSLVNDVDEKLAPNGIFVLGNHTQEHLYIADKYTPADNKVPCGDNIELMTVPPHLVAFDRNGHFKKCYEGDIKLSDYMSMKMPLIWQKCSL